MMSLTDKHDRAMAIADEADAVAARGGDAEASRLYRSAFELEKAAADETAGRPDLEPTRSILHRSAASLALQINEYRECERLVCRALAGDPPSDIAAELRELWERTSASLRATAKAFAVAGSQ
jgi:hypothetical protein